MAWDGMDGREGGDSCKLLTPLNAGMTVASALGPGLLLCLSFVPIYYGVLFHFLNSSTSDFMDYGKSQALKPSNRQQVLCP